MVIRRIIRQATIFRCWVRSLNQGHFGCEFNLRKIAAKSILSIKNIDRSKLRLTLYSFVLIGLALFYSSVFTNPRLARGASFTSYQTGNWNDQCTWSAACNGGLPASGDSVTISSGHTVTITTGNAVNIGGGAITVNGSLVMSDALTSGDLSISSGQSLTTNGYALSVGSLTNAGTITAGASAISVSGSFTNSSTFTAGTSTITMTATSTGKTFTAGTGQTYNNITFNGVGGEWTLQDALTTGNAATITLTAGRLITNNNNISCGVLRSQGTLVRRFSFGTSVITTNITSSYGYYADPNTNLTIDSSDHEIIIAGSGGGIYANGPINKFTITGLGSHTLVEYNGPWGTLTVSGTANTTDLISLVSNINVSTSLNLLGNSATNRLKIQSNTQDSARIITSNGTNNIKNADFLDITAVGTANWDLSNIEGRSGDCGHNTGITFSGAVPKYWVGNGGNWSDATNHWATSSGGTPGAENFPLPQDDVSFDANSFNTNSQTVTTDTPRIGKSVNWTGATNSPTWTRTLNYELFGSLTLISSMSFTAPTNNSMFRGRGTYYLTSAGKGMGALTLRIPGTLVLMDSLSVGNFYIQLGNFNANGFNVTANGFNCNNGAGINVVTLGTGIWNISGNMNWNPWSVSGSGLILDTTNSTLTFTYASGSLSFAGGGFTYNNVSFGAGTAAWTIAGSNTFSNLAIVAPRTITFTSGTTQIISETFNAIGASGSLITMNASTPGTPATLTKANGNIDIRWASIQDITATGGATWQAHYSTSVSGNSGITFPTYKTVSDAGGNWNAGTAWVGGVVPSNTDDVNFTATSGALAVNVVSTCNDFYTGSYTNTVTLGAALTVTNSFLLAGGTYNSVSYNTNVGGNYGRTSGTFTAGTGTITMNGTALGKTFTAGGQTYNNITFNGVGGGWILLDSLTTNTTTAIITLTTGSLATNNKDISARRFNVGDTGTRALYLGSSTITLSGTNPKWISGNSTSFTLSSGTSTLIITGADPEFASYPGTYYNVQLNITSGTGVVAGVTMNNFTVMGSAASTTLQSAYGFTVNGALSLNGNSTVNRLYLRSDYAGAVRTVTLGAAATFKSNSSYLDLQDIRVTGGATDERDLSGITGGSGDCGGNTGITFTPAVPQTFTNASGGNWSEISNWTSRVPLPQDNVSLARVGGYNTGAIIIVDMTRIGKNVDCTGMTWTGTATSVRFNNKANTIFGSMTLVAGMIVWHNQTLTFAGRTNSYLISAGNGFGSGAFNVAVPGVIFTLQDAFILSTNALYLQYGTLTANANVTIWRYQTSAGTTTNMGNVTWTLTGTNATVWYNAGTVNGGNSTISITDTAATPTTFMGSTSTYNNIVITPGAGTLTYSGAFTFANMSMSGPGTKTIKFTSSTTYTMTGTDFLSGSSTAPNISTILNADTGNANFETLGAGGADVFGTWTESVTGSSTISAETGDRHGGNNALKITVDSGLSNAYVSQSVLLTIGKTYKATYWAKTDSGTTAKVQLGTPGEWCDQPLTTTWTKYSFSFKASQTGFIVRRGNSSSSRIIYVDDVLLEEISGVVVSSTGNDTSVFTISKASGTVDTNHIALKNSVATGGATWNAHYSVNGSGNTGWNFPSYKIVSNAGGNWDATASWVEGSVPATTDEIGFTAASGALAVNVASTCAAINTVGYANTITAGQTLTVTNNFILNGGTYNAVSYNLNVGGNFARVSGTFTAGTGTITMNATSTGKTFTGGGQTYRQLTFDGVGGGWTLLDTLNLDSTWGTLKLTNGSLNTNNQTLNIGAISSNNSNTRTLTLGSSVLNLSGMYSTDSSTVGFNTTTGMTFNADTSTINISKASAYFVGGGKTFNNVNFTGGGTNIIVANVGAPTIKNMTVTGTVSKTNILQLNVGINITDSLNLNGNSVSNRILVQSDVLGTARTIDLGASATFKTNSSNIDFQDVKVIGGLFGDRDLSNIPGGSGDCGGNSGIILTDGTTQTFTNPAGGNWSEPSNWTSRIPLPQDDVSLNRGGPYNSGVTITIDMPRVGKSINATGMTWTGTATTLNHSSNSAHWYIYGSLTLISTMTYISNTSFDHFMGRADYTLDSAGKYFNEIRVEMYNGRLTLQNNINMLGANLVVNYGTFDANDYNVSTMAVVSSNTNKRAIYMGDGTWTLTYINTLWNFSDTTNLVFDAENSTIAIIHTTATQAFYGNSLIYNNIVITPGSGPLTFSGAFTFSNMTMSEPGTKTIKFTKNTTYTMTGANFLTGNGSNLITVSSDTGGTPFTLTKSSGTVSCDYLSVQDSTATGGAEWFAGANSANVSGNDAKGWIFAAPSAQDRYWVSSSSTDWNSINNWSNTSNGTAGYSIPTSLDNAIFDGAGSKNASVTLNAALTLNSLDIRSGYTGNINQNTQPIHTSSAFSLDGIDLSLSGPLSSSGTASIATNRTLNLNGYGLGVDGAFSSSGTLKFTGDESVRITNDTDSGTIEYAANSGTRDLKNWTYYSLKINGNGGTFNLPADLTLNGDIILANGTLTENGHNLSVGGSWTNTGGTFNMTTGTVTMTATSTGKTITSGNTAFYNLIFNGTGGGWTLQDNLTCTNITLTAGNLIDNAKTVTVNGNISIANTESILTSTGVWAHNTSGTFRNPTLSNKIKEFQINNGVTTTLTAGVRVGKITLASGTTITGNYQLLIHPVGDYPLTQASGSVIDTSEIRIYPASGTTYKQGAITTTKPLYIVEGGNITFQMTGNWSTGSVQLWAYSAARSEATALVLDTNGFNLNVNGYLYVGNGTSLYGGDGYRAKVFFRNGTHNITGNLQRMGDLTYGWSYYDLGQANISVGGNIDFTNSTVVSGNSTVNLTAITSGKTIKSGGQSFNNITFNGTGGGWTLQDGLDVNSDLKLQAGTLNSNSQSINVGRDWNRVGGTFTPGNTVVTLDSAQFGHVYGDTSFYDLSIDTSSASTNTLKGVNFAANSTQTITHALTLNGALNKPLTLGREGGSLTDHWNLILPANYTSGPYINVNSSNINSPYQITADVTVSDYGNNHGWIFPSQQSNNDTNTIKIRPNGDLKIKGDVLIK